MPVRIKVFALCKTVRIRYSGAVDIIEVMEALARFLDQLDDFEIDKHLIDLRKLAKLNDNSLKHMLLHEHKLEQLMSSGIPIRMAYLLASDPAPGAAIAKMAVEAANHTPRIQAGAFFDEADAFAFLHLSKEDAELLASEDD